MNKIELLKEVIEKVDNGGIGVTGSVANQLEENGIENNMHVGKPKEFFNDNEKVAEWYLGQFLNIIDKKSWFAMNSLINQSYSWTKKAVTN